MIAREAVRRLRLCDPGAAERFLSGVRKTMEVMIRTPHGGAPKRLSREALRGLRSWPVKGFEDQRVYYLAHEAGVRVVRKSQSRP